MKNSYLVVDDVTLRDAQQGGGFRLSLGAMVKTAQMLDALGVDRIEAGWPGANHTWDQFFELIAKGQVPLQNAAFTVFGSTRRAKATVKSDQLFQKVISSPVSVATIFGKSWLRHVEEALCTTGENNLLMIEESVRAARQAGKQVTFDAEHFFQSWIEDGPEYALCTLRAAVRGGASILCLCDTNGVTIPLEVYAIVKAVSESLGDQVIIGVHMHNDGGMADANTVTAIQAGARHFQGTLLGVAERAGMACTTTVLGMIKRKRPELLGSQVQLNLATEISRELCSLSGLHHNPRQPMVGDFAYTHKAGVHVHAALHSNELYEGFSPETFGQTRRYVLSSMAGQANVRALAASELNVHEINQETVRAILDEVEERMETGHNYDQCLASATLLLARHLRPEWNFTMSCSEGKITSMLGDGSENSFAKLTVVMPDGQVKVAAHIGNGPYNALFQAAKQALPKEHPAHSLTLLDFRDFVLPSKDSETNSATGEPSGSRVRLEIDWEMPGIPKFSTQGVSTNIMDAALAATIEAFHYVELLFVYLNADK